jgi:hypothetical protein
MWKAVDAMIKGLYRQSKRSDFKIDMATFGFYSGTRKKCFGCAATCTIQQIGNVNFKDDQIHEAFKNLNVSNGDLQRFENAIDTFRTGYAMYVPLYNMQPLLHYFKLTRKKKLCAEISKKSKHLLKLDTFNWRTRIPEYRKFCKYLKKLDV